MKGGYSQTFQGSSYICVCMRMCLPLLKYNIDLMSCGDYSLVYVGYQESNLFQIAGFTLIPMLKKTEPQTLQMPLHPALGTF